MIRILALAGAMLALLSGTPGELLTNRNFEEKGQYDAGWSIKGCRFSIDDADPVHPATPHYLTLYSTAGTVVSNDCKGGVNVSKGEILYFEISAKSSVRGKMSILLISPEGEIVGANVINVRKGEWKSYRSTIEANRNAEGCTIDIVPPFGLIMLDAASLSSKD